jgi:hypothetical protein
MAEFSYMKGEESDLVARHYAEKGMKPCDCQTYCTEAKLAEDRYCRQFPGREKGSTSSGEPK